MAFTGLNWVALGVFAWCTVGYHLAYAWYARVHPMRTVKGKIQRYRRDWVEGVIKTRNYIMAVQAARNLIMTTTFLASSILLVMAFIFNYIITGRVFTSAYFEVQDPTLLAVKVYMLLGLFAVAFLAFLLAIRLLNHFSVLIGVSPELIAQIEGVDPADYLAHLINKAASRHTIGLRAAYFALPAAAWLFNTWVFIVGTVVMWLGVVLFLDVREAGLKRWAPFLQPKAPTPAAGPGAGPPTPSAPAASPPSPKS